MVLMDKGHVIGAGPLEDLQSDPSLPLAAARDAAVSFEGVVQSSDDAYGLVTLKVRGGVLTAPAPPAPVGERRRIRVIASDVSLTREAPGPKLDPQRPSGAHRVDEAARHKRGRGRRRRSERTGAARASCRA